jgi:helix-turn-helix protein
MTTLDVEHISLAEAARRCGHSAVTLRQAAQRGRLQAHRVGEGNRATWFTTERDLAAYLAGRRSWKTYRAELIRQGGDR